MFKAFSRLKSNFLNLNLISMRLNDFLKWLFVIYLLFFLFFFKSLFVVNLNKLLPLKSDQIKKNQ